MQQSEQQQQIAPELPPRPPLRPRATVCVSDCCIVQIDTGTTSIQSPPTPSHYEPPPVPLTIHHDTGSGPAVVSGSSTATNNNNNNNVNTNNRTNNNNTTNRDRIWKNIFRKYVILCTACGGMAALLGSLFLLVHFVLRAHTTSLNYFETVPTYVPAIMLTVTGLVVMCFARRKNRYGYLIKVCGVSCLVCAVLCVVVTVTTTVIHMHRLQTLNECTYIIGNQSCNCTSGLPQEEGKRFVFNGISNCEVVHGALYSCLRALFGLSVIGILVCIFSCMLVYQLHSHEKKKMYWEQLEMRCRYLYGSRRNPQYTYCGCNCDDCPRGSFPPHASSTNARHHHQRNDMFPWSSNSWEQQGYLDDRFCSRVHGNLYTPSPDEPQQQQPQSSQQQHQQSVQQSGVMRWSWLPWNRNSTAPPNLRENIPVHVDLLEPARGPGDSEYGFGHTRSRSMQGCQVTPVCRPIVSHAFVTDASASTGLPRYLWGPPPPYSQPPSNGNSLNPSPLRQTPDSNTRHVHPNSPLHQHQHPISSPQHQNDAITPAHSIQTVSCAARIRASEEKIAEITQCTGTLPCRKTKKRLQDSSAIIKSQQIQPASLDEGDLAASLRKLGPGIRGLFSASGSKVETGISQSAPTSTHNSPHKVMLHAAGVRKLNTSQLIRTNTATTETTESEVYFADVSSCNGGPESSLYDEPNNTTSVDLSQEEYIFTESRLAPDAQYEVSTNDEDNPLRDSDATIDSGVHSGSEINSRLRQIRVQNDNLSTRSVNV